MDAYHKRLTLSADNEKRIENENPDRNDRVLVDNCEIIPVFDNLRFSTEDDISVSQSK
jgi:hypothetical protein